MSRILRALIHVLLYVLAVYLFLWGLGDSLTSDSTTLGGILWVLAAVIMVANTGWTVWRLWRSRAAS